MKRRAENRKRLKATEKYVRTIKKRHVPRREITKMAKHIIRAEHKYGTKFDPVKAWNAVKAAACVIAKAFKNLFNAIVDAFSKNHEKSEHQSKMQLHNVSSMPPLRTRIPANAMYQVNTGASGFMIHRQKR